jgi:hypothetical protein
MRLRTTAVRNLRQISRSNKNRLRFIVLCAVRARHDLDRSLFRSTIESGRCEQSILLPRGCDASSLLSDAAKLRGALRRGPKRRKNRRCGDHSMVQEAPGAQSPINIERRLVSQSSSPIDLLAPQASLSSGVLLTSWGCYSAASHVHAANP